jgi:hypothetical protein
MSHCINTLIQETRSLVVAQDNQSVLPERAFKVEDFFPTTAEAFSAIPKELTAEGADLRSMSHAALNRLVEHPLTAQQCDAYLVWCEERNVFANDAANIQGFLIGETPAATFDRWRQLWLKNKKEEIAHSAIYDNMKRRLQGQTHRPLTSPEGSAEAFFEQIAANCPDKPDPEEITEAYEVDEFGLHDEGLQYEAFPESPFWDWLAVQRDLKMRGLHYDTVMPRQIDEPTEAEIQAALYADMEDMDEPTAARQAASEIEDVLGDQIELEWQLAEHMAEKMEKAREQYRGEPGTFERWFEAMNNRVSDEPTAEAIAEQQSESDDLEVFEQEEQARADYDLWLEATMYTDRGDLEPSRGGTFEKWLGRMHSWERMREPTDQEIAEAQKAQADEIDRCEAEWALEELMKFGDYEIHTETSIANSDEQQEIARRAQAEVDAETEAHALCTVAYFYGVGHFDDHDKMGLLFGCTQEEVDQMAQQIQNETKEEREDRLIRLECPCAEDLKVLRRKRATVSPAEAERLNVEFGTDYGYPNLLIMNAQDRIRLGCPNLTDLEDLTEVPAEDAVTEDSTLDQDQAQAEAEVLSVIRDNDWWYWDAKIPKHFSGYYPKSEEDRKCCIREIRESAARRNRA